MTKTLWKIFFILTVSIASLLVYPNKYFVLNKTNDVCSQSENWERGKVGAYVINLDRSIERFDYIKNNVTALGFPMERVSGVDGLKLSKDEIQSKVDLDAYKFFMGKDLKVGTIGCYLSHVKTWESFLNSEYEFALIVEDDVSFNPKKLRTVIDYLTNHQELWDIVSFEIRHRGSPLAVRKIMEDQILAVYLAEITDTGAYLINRRMAKKLLEKAFPIKMPVDHYFTRQWEFGMKFIGVENPRLVYQTFGQSEIERSEGVTSKKLPWWDLYKRAAFKLQSYVMRFIYNLKVYLELKQK